MSKLLFIMTNIFLCCAMLIIACITSATTINAYAAELSTPTPLILPTASTNSAEEASIAPTVDAPSEVAEVTTKEVATPSWKGSLLFLPSELQALKEALESAAATASSAETDTSTIQSLVSNIPNSFSPTYYLNSILYVSPDNWAIWVNGIRYSSQSESSNINNSDQLEVTAISPLSARIRTRMRLLSRIYPTWQEKFSPNIDGDFVANHDKTILISKEKDFITFSLKPNQSLALSTMEIREGL